MHDSLPGDIRRLLSAKANIFWNMSEQDLCVYMKLSALTGSQQTYKRIRTWLCMPLCIPIMHNTAQFGSWCKLLETYTYCTHLHVFRLTGDCECSYCTFAYLELFIFWSNLGIFIEAHLKNCSLIHGNCQCAFFKLNGESSWLKCVYTPLLWLH